MDAEPEERQPFKDDELPPLDEEVSVLDELPNLDSALAEPPPVDDVTPEDIALMEKAKTYEKKLMNFYWRLGVSYHESEDYVQETYIRLWNYRRTYQETAKLSTFLYLMARQVRIDALRRKIRRENREKIYEAERPPRECSAPCTRDDVRWALSQLTEPLREVVELGIFQDLPYAEVSKILGIPEGTVKSRMFNALRKLRKIVHE